MTWIKCEDRLPESMEPVLVTGILINGEKAVWADVRYNAEIGGWEVLSDAAGDYWEDVEYEITHWMSYPEPAED